ncbi:MAG: hypothetical protein KBT07_06035 [Clostridiales bacterium]|nr:hypothetical protein [Candidatus Scatonaster coprocaballi]
MKKLRKVIAAVMIASMGLSLASCKSYKKISSDEFTKIMEENDYEVYEEDFRGYKEYLYAVNEDGTITFEYYLGEKKSVVNDFFDAAHDNLKAENKSGTIKQTTNKITFKGKMDEDSSLADLEYVVLIKSDDMLIAAYSTSKDSDYIDEVDDLMKEMCG